MMKQLFILLFAISLFGCKSESKVDYALFSGKFINASTDKFSISGTDFEKEISIRTDGTFSDTLKLIQSKFLTLNVGREFSSIYLKNGFDLKMTIDANIFDESIKYEGIGASENNYLASKSLKNETAKSNPAAFFGVDPSGFKTMVENTRKENLKSLEALEDVDEDFIAFEQKNIEYDAYADLNTYESAHAYYAKQQDFKVSDDFIPSELKTLKYDDANAYGNSISYKQLAYGNALDGIFESIGDDYNEATTANLQAINNIGIPALKQDVIDYLGRFMVSPSNPNMKSIHDFLLSNSSREETKKSLNETYEKNKSLITGMPSPQFVNYENHKGGTMSLTDLKGKYVYIDVWATWCAPCKREIPFLKEVEKQYGDKNIEFISISIDVATDHTTWVEMVKNEQLGGIQLMADNNWKSKFVTDYVIEGIPRFILVDPNGNIVSADAPRPSDPKLVDLFSKLKI